MRIPKHPPAWQEVLSARAGDIAHAMTDARYQRLVRDADASYRHWDKLHRIARSEGLDAEVLWAIVKLGRHTRLRPTPFTSTLGQTLLYDLLGPVAREIMLIDQQLAGHIGIGTPNILSAGQRERFIVSSLMEEAIASSMLEGAATTVRIAKDMLRAGRKPRDRSERMIVNNYAAIQHIREHTSRKLDIPFLLELQEIVTTGTLSDQSGAGRLRLDSDDVEIVDHEGNVFHTPPPAAELRDRLSTLCDFANDAPSTQDFMHPAVRAMLLHFQLSYIHPFVDGNGRTARALFMWYMLRSGYWLFEWLPISRAIRESPSQYGRAFLYTETDDFDGTYFLMYHAMVIRRCRETLDAYLERKHHELASTQSRVRTDDRLNHRQHTLLVDALRRPDAIYTIETHQNSHGISYGTARADLISLQKMDYLIRHRVGNRFEFHVGPKVRTLAE